MLQQFVCVRVVGTNGLDLNLFQYGTQSMYCGVRAQRGRNNHGRFRNKIIVDWWLQDVSLEGMAQALSGALELHDDYPANKRKLAGKNGEPLEFASRRSILAWPASTRILVVVKSCIHCHQIGEARREFYWQNKKSIPEQLMHPYPHPKSIGLILDPTKRAVVKSIADGTPASKSGLQIGDEILTMSGQPLLSTADVQWVLNQTSSKSNET
ncbi:MAG: PDZ domain-containing protein [Pirellulales bacterium]